MNINVGKVAFEIAIEWHFRDGVPEEWYDFETEEEFNKAFDEIPALIDDTLLVVEEWLENEMSQAVANLTWNLFNFTRSTFAKAIRECE